MKGELGKERARFVERTYEGAVQSYLAAGMVDDKLQREMISLATQRLKPQQPITPDRVFDFSFARKARHWPREGKFRGYLA